ncbi:hypothetical protein BVRB_020340, partial [Beta vulgaris subsp. vulgaris]
MAVDTSKNPNTRVPQSAVNVADIPGSGIQTNMKSATPEKFTLSAGNPISGLTFFWIFRLLWKCLFHGPGNVHVSLENRARAEPASNALNSAWEDQPQTLLQATFKAFGARYLMLGLWKIA